MADRSLYSHLSDPAPNGFQFMEQYADRLGQLFSAAIWPLGSVGGTGNAVTASCDPPLTAGLAEHMRFSLTWAATNSGAMTLALNGGSPAAILMADGSAMIAGAAKSGAMVLLEYVSGAFRIIGGGNSGGAVEPYFTQITASTTWNKPAGYPDDAVVTIEAWGGGGGGARNNGGIGTSGGGGGGGCYIVRRGRYADIPSSLAITIGAGGAASGGAPGGAGGTTTVGALLRAFGGAGGGQGASNVYGLGGMGGGEITEGLYGGHPGGGIPGVGGAIGVHARTIWGGGGGGSADSAGAGGQSVFGGGGGGSGHNGSGAALGERGWSLFGGHGGAGGRFNDVSGTPGTAPGGGGGGAYTASAANGARGEVRIWING